MVRSRFGRLPLARLEFGDQRFTDLLADVRTRHAKVRNGGNRHAGAVEQAVIDRDDFHVVALGGAFDRLAKLDVGSADHETLGFLRRQVVDCGDHFFAVRHADLHQGEAQFLGRLFGAAPLVLEPRFLGLLDQKADLDRIGRTGAVHNEHAARAQQGCQSGTPAG
jgi:hypothetical protein